MREFAVKYAWKFIGVAYEWGGDNSQGLDCSGFVGVILRAVGLMDNREDLTASGIHNKFREKAVDAPYKGCLVFYGRSKKMITHIAFMVDDHRILEAGGGGSKTTTKEMADEHNAFVRGRPYAYRPPVAFVDPFLTD